MCIDKLYDKIIRNSKEAERQYLSMATKPIVSKAEKLKESPITDEAFKEQLERVLRDNVLDTDIRITGDTVIGATKNPNREISKWSDNFEEAVADLIERAKQGKCDSLSPIEEGNKLLAIAKHGRVNHPEWSEEDEDYMKDLMDYFGHNLPLEHTPHAVRDWLKSLHERFNLQPKQEWNEEDEKAINHVINTLESMIVTAERRHADEAVKHYTDIKNKVKSLRPSWKPSEEELVALKRVGSILRDYGHSELAKMVFMVEGKLANLSVINKSIWKPSEEQLVALKVAMDRNDSIGYNLRQLYEQLKKL